LAIGLLPGMTVNSLTDKHLLEIIANYNQMNIAKPQLNIDRMSWLLLFGAGILHHNDMFMNGTECYNMDITGSVSSNTSYQLVWYLNL